MAKNNKYWQERFEQIEQAANNKSVRFNRTLEKKYRLAAGEIDAQINKWYNRIAKNNMMSISEARRLLTANELKEFKWTVEEYIAYGRQNALDQQWVKELENASAKFHINRLEAMKLEVRHQIEMAMAGGQQDMFDVLGNVYKDTFYRSSFELQKGVGIGFDVAKLDDTTVSRVLSKPWAADGTNFSDKLWSNKKKLINTLDTELSRMVLLGDTPDRAVKTIKEAMNSSLFQAKRLVLTEQAYFATEAQKKAFNSLDVERFEVVSSADRKTCPVCAAKDKKNFPMIEFHIGITAPPFHPLCRCVTAPFFDDEFTSQTRIVKDDAGEKYEIPATMNYQEWKDAFLGGGSKKGLAKAGGRGIIRSGVTEAGIFVDTKDKLHDYAKKIKPLEGYDDFVCHATPDEFLIYDGDYKMPITPERYAELIKLSSDFHDGPIRIISCQAGAKANGVAQKLADELGVKVLAPTEIVNVDDKGRMFVSDNETLADLWDDASDEEKAKFKETGTWVEFEPRKGRAE